MIKELLLKAQKCREPISVTYGVFGNQVEIEYNPIYKPSCAIIVTAGIDCCKFSMKDIDKAIETFKTCCGWDEAKTQYCGGCDGNCNECQVKADDAD